MFDQIMQWLAENWAKFLGLVTFLTVIPAYLRARYVWKRREFMTRINFSLNFYEDETLKFRTIRESDLAHVLLDNSHAIGLLLRVARSKRSGAFLLFKDKEEAWTILTMLLNELSALFYEGFVARSMGLPSHSEWYCMGLTCERHGDLKSTRIRVMIVPRKLLAELDSYDPIRFEQPHHHIRLTTLKEMKEIHADPNRKFNLADMEITVKC